jgi:O-antigen/teichoic acid export membrane protein
MAESTEKTIATGTLWFSINSWLLRGVGLVTVFFILRNLSIYEYGLVELVLSIVPLFGILLLPGLNNVVITDMAIEKGRGNISEMKSLFVNFMTLHTVLSTVAWAIVFFGASIIDHFYSEQVTALIRIVSFFFLLSPIRSALGTIFTVYLKFFTQSVLLFLEEFFKLVFILLAFFVFDLRASGVLLSGLLGSFLAFVVVAPVYFKVYGEFSGVKIENKKPFWSVVHYHGKWSVFSSYLNQAGAKLRIWIVQVISGTEAVALFAVAEGLIGHTTALVPIGKVVAPIIPKFVDQKEKFLHIINKSIKYQFFGHVVVAVLGLTLFPVVILYLFPQYETSVTLYKIMLIMLIPTTFASVFQTMFFALKKQKILFYANIYRVVLVGVTTPIGLHFWGIKGIAYGFLVVISLFTIERYRILRRLIPEFRITLSDFWTFDDYDKLLIDKLRNKFKS